MLQWIEKVYQQVQNYRPPTHLIRGYAQGVALCDYLIFLGYLSWNERLRAGALYGNLTRDAVLAFLGQICTLVQQTD